MTKSDREVIEKMGYGITDMQEKLEYIMKREQVKAENIWSTQAEYTGAHVPIDLSVDGMKEAFGHLNNAYHSLQVAVELSGG